MKKEQTMILIIDDDERNIFALKAVLTAKKFCCLAANGALQAMEILKQETGIDVALVDMMMPGMDGYELMGILKTIPGHKALFIVAVTAQAMPGDKEKCMAAGADAYISKPVDIDRLLDVIEKRIHK